MKTFLRKLFRIKTKRIIVQYVGTAIAEQAPLAYAQAGSWIQMVNYVTWTLASAFVLGSLVALSAALQRPEFDEMRLVMPVVWFPLALAWIVFDRTYLKTADVARAVVNKIEAGFPKYMRPYSNQSASGRSRVNKMLYLIAVFILAIWAAIFGLAVNSRLTEENSCYKRLFAVPAKPSSGTATPVPSAAATPSSRPCGLW